MPEFTILVVVVVVVVTCYHPGGGGVLGLTFAGYVLLASQNPHPIIVYSVTNYKPYLSHFWANG